MTPLRKDRTGLTRTSALAWLERRINYERVVPSAANGATFGLARMRRLLAAVGAPHKQFPVVHVAGTKGKGSTVAMIAAVLVEAGYVAGRYMSPHVHSIEERIAVNGRPISSADLIAAFAMVIPAVDAIDRAAVRRGTSVPTWFEVMTAVAMVHFARKQVSIAVLETGLGGRLDATRVSEPLLSIITSISFDHMALLGNSLAQIAGEKAGIIKRGCPVISGVLAPSARKVIAATASRRRAPLLQLGRDFQATHRPCGSGPEATLLGGMLDLTVPGGAQATSPLTYRVGMPGQHQAINAALAIVAAQQLGRLGFPVPLPAILRGIEKVHLPARIETLSQRPLVVVDAAHNVASMQTLIETLAPILETVRPRVLVFAASADKQIAAMLATATERFDRVVVTRYATNPRAATIEHLRAACRTAGLPQPLAAESPAQALRKARSLAGTRGFVCIAGSFFLASEISDKAAAIDAC